MTRESAGIAVVCVGNSLVADDAAGSEVFEQLDAQHLPDHVHLHHLGVGGMNLLDVLGGESHLIVVDAVQFGGKPGTMHVLDWNELPGGTNQPISVHGIGIREVIEVGRTVCPELMPQEVRLIGIEGKCFDSFVTEMSPEVQEAVKLATGEVLRQLDEFSETS